MWSRTRASGVISLPGMATTLTGPAGSVPALSAPVPCSAHRDAHGTGTPRRPEGAAARTGPAPGRPPGAAHPYGAVHRNGAMMGACAN